MKHRPNALAVGIPEAAGLVGLSPRQIRREIDEDRLRAVKAGRRVLIPMRSLEKWMEALEAVA